MPGGCWIIGRFNASCLVFHTEIIFPLQKVICTAEALHRLVFALISHISSILAPMPCSMQFSRITDFFNNQQSQLGPGRNPSMCAATQVVTGLPARTLQPNQLLPTLVQAGTTCGASSQPDLIQNHFLIARMLRFLRHSRQKVPYFNISRQKVTYFNVL